MHRSLFAAVAGIAVLLSAACAGSRGFVPAAPDAPAASEATGSGAQVTVTITVATKSAPARAEAGRHPHYFSAASRGLLIAAYPHGKHKRIAETVVDISPGAAACGKKKTIPRTCSAKLMLSPSKGDDLTIFDYNVAPVSGKIPRSAHAVGYGKLVNQKIAPSAKKNRFTVYLGGVIAGVNYNSAPIVFPGDGEGHTAALIVDPVDFGDDPITAGKKDPYANPIAVSVAETGGTGHTLLSLNGASGAKSVELKHSTDTVEVEYDGGGAVGYGARIGFRSKKIKNTGPVVGGVNVAPFIVGSTSTDLTAGSLALKGNGDYVPIGISDVNAPGGTTFAVSTQHCDAIESTMPLTQASVSSGKFAVIARGVAATPNPAGCSVSVSDGTSTLDFVVSNTYSGSVGVPVIATTAIPNPSASPNEITVGPDGALWFALFNAGKIGRVEAGTVGTHTIEPHPVPTGASAAKVIGVYAGPDGNVWFDDCANQAVGKLTTAGAVAGRYAVNGAYPYFVTTGSDGNMWYTQYYRPISNMTTAGTIVGDHSTGLTGDAIVNEALGPDGDIWFTEGSLAGSYSAAIGKVTPSGTITEFPLPNSSADPWGITAGPDGAMWFTECNGGPSKAGAIGRIPVTATSASDITEYSTGMTGQQPVDITAGPDGALWFMYWNTVAAVGRITTNGTITQYPIPGASSSANGWGITSGPDGALYFVEDADNVLGRIAIGSTPVKGSANRVHRALAMKASAPRPSQRHPRRNPR